MSCHDLLLLSLWVTEYTKAPKTLPSAAKQAAVLKYFHESRVAHSIKDLEKELPKAASISSMQVKDFLQALSDDNKIHVEKIGSGNWYWAFAGEEKRNRENLLAGAEEERDKAQKLVDELQAKVDAAGAAREEEDEMFGAGMNRKTLTDRHARLTEDLKPLRDELACYSDNDPVEIGRKCQEAKSLRQSTEEWSDQIMCMEDWLKNALGGNKEALLNMKRDLYGDHFDEEDQGLKEL